MKKVVSMRRVIFILLGFMIFMGCAENEESVIYECTIVTPLADAKIPLGTTIDILVESEFTEGTVKSVRILWDDTLFTSLSVSPFVCCMNTSNLGLGPHKLSAVCENLEGVLSSDAINIELIENNDVFICSFLTPENNEEIVQGMIVNISILAEFTEGLVKDIVLYIDGEEEATLSTSPYDYEWNTTNLELGNHMLKAVCESDAGLKISEEIKVHIIETAPTVSDWDGNVYQTVIIGSKTWMAENLRTKHYPDGFAIPTVTDENENGSTDDEWAALPDEGFHDAVCVCEESNLEKFGALYTLSAAEKACPSGWHLPTDNEWEELKEFIRFDGHQDTEGAALKSTEGWDDNGNGSDAYGFNAQASGSRSYSVGLFLGTGSSCGWWTNSESETNTYYSRGLLSNKDELSRSGIPKSAGLSVRCIKD